MALAHGGTVFIDQGHRTADQRLRQFLRIGDGGAAENELRMTAVELAQAHQPAEHVGQVAAEDAAVGVDFVNHDIPQVLKQLDPLGVMGQDAGMQHIRVGHHDVACLPHGAAGRGGRIPVVCISFDINTHAFDHVIQLADLVGGQGLCRKQIERPGVLILQDGGKHGQVIAHRLAGSRGRHDGHVFPAGNGFQAFRLVGIKAVDPPLCQHGNEPGIQVVREGGSLCRPGRDNLPPGDILHELVVPPELLRKLSHVHFFVLPLPVLFVLTDCLHYKSIILPMQGEQTDLSESLIPEGKHFSFLSASCFVL